MEVSRDSDRTAARDTAARELVLVGNPNVGKSVIFGALTRRYVYVSNYAVSNYPGTTVEFKPPAADDVPSACPDAA